MINSTNINFKRPGTKLHAIVLAVLLLCCNTAWTQERVFADEVFVPKIKSVEFYNRNKEQSLPVINLNSADELLLAFDDLSAENKNYYYTIEHCDAGWKSSNLSPIDYLQSFNEEKITESQVSFNTIQGFNHYELVFPNEFIRPKIDGNYILKVYENADADKVILTRRFYVLATVVNLAAEIVSSPQVATRRSNQKVNITINHPQLAISNPYTDVKLVVMQNGRPDKQQILERPALIRQNQLIYNDVRTLDFEGGNEFRKFDFRSLRLQSENVSRIYKDSVNTVQLLTDQPYTESSYSYSFDENGNFFIRNQDGRDAKFDADYAYITFTLKSEKPTSKGNAYIVGKFNHYRLSEENKLIYDKERSLFYGSLYLKQGLYDYQYVWSDGTNLKKTDNTIFEGSFFETKNTYQAFFYYRRPGSRWDQLAGFQEFNK